MNPIKGLGIAEPITLQSKSFFKLSLPPEK